LKDIATLQTELPFILRIHTNFFLSFFLGSPPRELPSRGGGRK